MRTIPRSPRQAIKAKCIDCTYDPAAAGSKLAQVTLCPCTDCQLWPYRPTTSAPIPDCVLRYYGIDPDTWAGTSPAGRKPRRVVAFPSITPPSGS